MGSLCRRGVRCLHVRLLARDVPAPERPLRPHFERPPDRPVRRTALRRLLRSGLLPHRVQLRGGPMDLWWHADRRTRAQYIVHGRGRRARAAVSAATVAVVRHRHSGGAPVDPGHAPGVRLRQGALLPARPVAHLPLRRESDRPDPRRPRQRNCGCGIVSLRQRLLCPVRCGDCADCGPRRRLACAGHTAVPTARRAARVGASVPGLCPDSGRARQCRRSDGDLREAGGRTHPHRQLSYAQLERDRRAPAARVPGYLHSAKVVCRSGPVRPKRSRPPPRAPR